METAGELTMKTQHKHFDTLLAASRFYAPVPGPDRKRTIRPYLYRVMYCSDNPEEIGCAMSVEVFGGRNSYQLALEREWDGSLRWHCTCADAVYRGEDGRHVCKHVKGLLGLDRPRQQMTCQAAPSAN
jgi:hypothetical protein